MRFKTFAIIVQKTQKNKYIDLFVARIQRKFLFEFVYVCAQRTLNAVKNIVRERIKVFDRIFDFLKMLFRRFAVSVYMYFAAVNVRYGVVIVCGNVACIVIVYRFFRNKSSTAVRADPRFVRAVHLNVCSALSAFCRNQHFHISPFYD